MYGCSAEILNDEDLEDGEIFEDEESANAKNLKSNAGQEKPKVQATHPVAPPVQKKILDSEKNHKNVEQNDKPPREQLVPFLNKGKKRHFDNHEEDSRWKKDIKVQTLVSELIFTCQRPTHLFCTFMGLKMPQKAHNILFGKQI